MKKPWILPAASVIAALVTLASVQSQVGDAPPPTSTATTVHPIAFPHNTHAGKFRIDCQYCHFSAERSVDAGMPPVSSCMGCHIIIQGRNRPEEVQKLRDFWDRGEPIPWVRIYKVPDHVKFPHMRHVAKDAGALECQECHGPVEEIEVMEEVEQPLKMGWCVQCHRDNDASVDCTVCHY
ncbi:MAG: cytochrome c3 family protein [Gemmatimonadota bacterium]